MCPGSHHGFVGVSSSLELNGAEGIGGAELRVFADRPLLRQAVILGQTFCLIILTGWDAWGQAHVLTYKTTATAPGREADVNCTVRLLYYTYPYRKSWETTATREATAIQRRRRKRVEGRDWMSVRVMCLAVSRGQGWSDSLSSDFHVLIGRRGGEGSVDPRNLLLALLLHKDLSFPFHCSPPPLPPSSMTVACV